MKLQTILIISTISLIVILSSLVISDSHVQCQDQFILVELAFTNNNFELKHKSLETGCFSQINNIGIFNEYTLNLQNQGATLYENSFNPVIIIENADEEGNLEGETINPESIILTMPYFEDVENLEIFDSNNNQVFVTTVFEVGATSCRIK